MELLTVGELTRTVMRGEEPTSDLSVQVVNQMVLVLLIDLFPGAGQQATEWKCRKVEAETLGRGGGDDPGRPLLGGQGGP